MSREEIHKLLGGYATGTLTSDEQQALFQAALDDQELFDALAREQSLQDLLRDPAARAHLLAALGERPCSRAERIQRWIWGRAVGLAAVACFLGVAGYVAWQTRYSAKPRVVVEIKEPTTIEVRSGAPGADTQASARRVFKPESAGKAAAARPPELPPPPSAPQMARATPAAEFLGAISGFAVTPPPVETVPSAPPALAVLPPPPPTPQPTFARSEFRAGTAAGAVGGVLPGASETVMVTAAAASVSVQDLSLGARALYYSFGADAADAAKVAAAARRAAMPAFVPQQAPAAASSAAPSAAPHLGLRYQVMRKLPSGGFERLSSGQSLAPGETVKLRFEPNDAGNLTVLETSANKTPQALLTAAVEQFGSAETPEISLETPGAREFRVTLVRQGAANGSAAINAPSVRSETDAGERTTYVVNAGADPKSPVSFTITLNWK